MELEALTKLLDLHPSGTLNVGLDGAISYANRSAANLLGSDEGDFYTSFSETADDVAAIVRRCAGSSAWQPIVLTLHGGEHDGMRIDLLCRGVRDPESGTISAVLVVDHGRRRNFEEHRELIRKLNAELAEQRKMRVRLDDALENETRLHRELIHRVKNNLSLLQSLIRFRAASSDDPSVEAALQDIQARVMSIALVHDLLDRKQQIDVLDARDLIETLCDQMESSICPPGVTIRRDLTSYHLHVSEATPLCLLINELVTNSLKHAFRDGETGTVEVALRRNGVDKIEVHVVDDGTGFDVNIGSSGTGSRIVRALSQQLRGELTVETKKGTAWQLIFAPSETGSAGAPGEADAEPGETAH